MATNLGRPLRDWLIEKLVTDATSAAGAGANASTVKSVVHELLNEKSIFEWLASINWTQLIQLVLQLLLLLPK